MARRWRNPWSFRTRLLLALVAVGAGSAAVVCTVLITIHFLATRDLARADLAAQVRVIAIHSEAALSFNDPEAGHETLAAFHVAPSVRWAALYDADGDLFAAYGSTDTPLPVRVDVARSRGGRELLMIEPVVHDDQRLGTVVAAYDPSNLYGAMLRDILLSIAVGAAVCGAAGIVAGRLRRYLVRPLRELVRAAHHISDTGDYSPRARKQTEDEFGDLTDTFNNMLDRIEQQDNALHRHNEEMQQFLYTVSHDLKSPLVTITGFVGLAREDLAQQNYAQLDESLAQVVRASKHMGRLIDDLLELSRVGRLRHRRERVQSGAIVEQVVADLAPRLEAAGATVQVQPDLPELTIDPLRLRQVFENLLTNAIKYGLTETSRTIEVGGERVGDEARFFVRDHGEGIAPAYRERVFVLFQRLHRGEEGTGVGLAIAAKIVETYGGRIWLEQTPGGGATFRFSLQAVDHPS